MGFILCPLLDPPLDEGDVFGLELFVALGRRHDDVRIRRFHEGNDQGFLRFAFDDDRAAVIPQDESILHPIQPQWGILWLAGAGIRAMAMITILRKHRLDVLIERNGLRQLMRWSRSSLLDGDFSVCRTCG